ncbi:MAG: XdhC family protein [Acidimicrobiales bacterium]
MAPQAPSDRLSARVHELRAARRPFVHATVVLAERPTSAKPGDEAIILPDGTIEGFVGGSCAESTVRERALSLLEAGDTLMLRITPNPEESQPGKQVVHNPCLSGGTMELYLEADVPPPLVVVVGHGPIAAALAAVGAQVGYELCPRPVSAAEELPPDTAAVVVASHGKGEQEILCAALEAEVAYLGLVASRDRGRAVVDALPVSSEQKAKVKTPAGLDIGARTPGEVAVSILAEIVSAGISAIRPRPMAVTAAARATDPVCGMTVARGDDALHVGHEGSDVWFCGRGCLDAFVADPAAYRRR